MWLRARRRIGGLLTDVLDEVMGPQKIFTISQLGDRGGSQKTITPSSLPNEDQVEVRLPLATFRVVLCNQLLVAGRCHANVDVGWPATVGDRHVALEAVLSSLAGKHRSPVCIVVVSPGVGQPELDPSLADRLTLFGGQHRSTAAWGALERRRSWPGEESGASRLSGQGCVEVP
jgi:hypothetical protein